eukprot:scaffold18049_cov117-Skeletonema_menzelii.AAC.1
MAGKKRGLRCKGLKHTVNVNLPTRSDTNERKIISSLSLLSPPSRSLPQISTIHLRRNIVPIHCHSILPTGQRSERFSSK